MVLRVDVEEVGEIVRARRSRRLPVVLSVDEVRCLLSELEGTPRLVATLLYGGGLRLLEALRLRVKDIDFEHPVLSALALADQVDRATGLRRRHHKHESVMQRAVRDEPREARPHSQLPYPDLRLGYSPGANTS